MLTRRFFVIAAPASLLAGCAGGPALPSFDGLFADRETVSGRSTPALARPNYQEIYGAYSGEQFPVPAFDYRQVATEFLRQTVSYKGSEPAGTVVVDPRARYLFFVEGDGRATRYGVGVGREGFGWSGIAHINMRRAWPDWVPPREMVERDPTVRPQLVSTSRGLGVPGGPRSPLGARAMYLYSSNGDTGYRIHGTTEPETIGTNVSSGCIRMVDQDVIHLYGRTPQGTTVVVLA